VEIANGTACTVLGLAEDELLGRDWFALTVPEPDRAAARATFASLLTGEEAALASTPGVRWRWSPSHDADGRPIGALGWGEPIRLPAAAGLTALP
jgi:hypothetical protein